MTRRKLPIGGVQVFKTLRNEGFCYVDSLRKKRLITCKEGVSRNKLIQHLEGKNIQTRMLFAGNLVRHPCFDELRKSGLGYRIAGTLDTTDRIMNDTFWVGVYPGMNDEMIDKMLDEIHEGLR